MGFMDSLNTSMAASNPSLAEVCSCDYCLYLSSSGCFSQVERIILSLSPATVTLSVSFLSSFPMMVFFVLGIFRSGFDTVVAAISVFGIGCRWR